MLVLLLAGCAATGPSLPAKDLEPAPQCTAPTVLGNLAARSLDAAPEANGILLLDTGREALRARVALVEAAECSIDAQYYIWNSDTTGRYLAVRLLAAADRGVRVRLLLDDINVGDRDAVLAALASHPNVELQIYNPFAERSGLQKAFGFLAEFERLNRRMHVKSFTVDGAVTILGGRNVGDEYFDSAEGMNHRDRDVLAVGAVVPQTAAMFQLFWDWPLARPIEELAGGTELPDTGALIATAAEQVSVLERIHGPLPREADAALRELTGAIRSMVHAQARLIHDPPPDPGALGDTDVPQPGSVALREVARDVQGDLLVESAYLVLDDTTLANVVQLRARGVRVRALTNSLASNDVTMNHAAYARRRRAMLASGIELRELRPDAESCPGLIRNEAACGPEHVFSLHAKTFVLDRRTVYVGSLNMNLRSRFLNAESGLVIDSPALAERIAGDIELNMTDANSWRPILDGRGRVRWPEVEAEGRSESASRWTHEPRVGFWRRVRSGFIALFPLEKYL
ncbi:MAG: phospholipase D family protein [Pseudomonadales bacterium]|nr:phospholipase D family protein [Pseudomonadales bacterium]